MTPPQVLVVGSLNLDVIVGLERIPGPGETVLTDSQEHGPGGKGGNQAIAAARCGAATAMIGAVGADDGGILLRRTLDEAGVDTTAVRRTDGPSGTAYVLVDSTGENAIVVVAGANGALDALSDTDRRLIGSAPILLMQLEIPMQTVLEAARIAHDAGGRVLLNAAPYAELPDELLAVVDLLIVNEHEAALTARAIRADGVPDDPEALSELILRRVPAVLITLGAHGSLLARRGAPVVRAAAHQVTVIDTTGAGDTFAGAYAAACADPEVSDAEALRFASAAAAIAVGRRGAVGGIPTRSEVDALLCVG